MCTISVAPMQFVARFSQTAIEIVRVQQRLVNTKLAATHDRALVFDFRRQKCLEPVYLREDCTCRAQSIYGSPFRFRPRTRFAGLARTGRWRRPISSPA